MDDVNDFDDHSVVLVLVHPVPEGHLRAVLPLVRPAIGRPAIIIMARFTRSGVALILDVLPGPIFVFEDPAHDIGRPPDLLRDFGAEDPMEPDTPTIQPINI